MKSTAKGALTSLLADGDLRAIRAKVEADFQKAVETNIAKVIQPIVEEVSQRHLEVPNCRLPKPVVLEHTVLCRLAAAYCNAVRDAVGAYAEGLVQAVSNRQRMGPMQLKLIMQETNSVIQKQTSPGAASAIIDTAAIYFQIGNDLSAQEIIAGLLGRWRDGPAKSHVGEKIRHALALHGGEQRLQPTPHEKVANPTIYPTMKVTEVTQVLNKSRSTVNRYLEEGKLKRARLRGSILTTSIVALLNENS